MKGYLLDGKGKRWELPLLTAWKMEYASDTPCDSFWIRCPWEMGQEDVLPQAARFEATEDGKTVFTGVVDECEAGISGSGRLLEVSGRSMAALLVDNEALPGDYMTMTTEDLLREHVTPYGIETANRRKLPAAADFTVASGSSEWSVLYNFARYRGGMTPYFDREGRLHLEGWGSGEERLAIDDTTPVQKMLYREKRYGVLSEAVVYDRYRKTRQTVKNEAFCQTGGSRRKVITMPGKSNYKAMRYQGAFQIEQSQREKSTVEIVLPWGFAAWPGDRVTVNRSEWAKNGVFRVREAIVTADGTGGTETKLILGSL